MTKMTDEIIIDGKRLNIKKIVDALGAQGLGLDIKTFANDANALKTGKKQKPENNKVIKTTTHQLVFVDYPDFCIEKLTPKTRQRLVIMPSCEGYYIKTFKGKEEYIEELTVELYVKFTSGMETITLPEGFWLKEMRSGKKFYDILAQALASKTYIDMIKHKVAPKMEDIIVSTWSSFNQDRNIVAYKKHPILYREFFNSPKAMTLLLEYTAFVDHLVEDFGINNTRDFLTQFELSLVEISRNYHQSWNGYGTRVYPDIEMKYNSFRDYVLYQSVFMGYGKKIRTFFNEWRDSIDMQQRVYNKVKEKYHENLPLWHSQLSYKCECMQEAIDEDKLKEMIELASLYQGVCGKYVFLTPTCKQDFLDEAQAQQNCLASYIKKFIDGECIIIFMRLKSHPSDSLVTIEIRKDEEGKYTKINQRYQARNRRCTPEQEDVIEKWLKRAVNRVQKKLAGEEVVSDEELNQVLTLVTSNN